MSGDLILDEILETFENLKTNVNIQLFYLTRCPFVDSPDRPKKQIPGRSFGVSTVKNKPK